MEMDSSGYFRYMSIYCNKRERKKERKKSTKYYMYLAWRVIVQSGVVNTLSTVYNVKQCCFNADDIATK